MDTTAGRWDAADPQSTADQPAQGVQVHAYGAGLGERAMCPRHHVLARLGHRDATRGAAQQLHAQLALDWLTC